MVQSSLLSIFLSSEKLRIYTLPAITVACIISGIIAKRTTIITNSGIAIRTLVKLHYYPWEELAGLNISRSGKITLVTAPASKFEGKRYSLPGVSLQNIHQIASASAGRITTGKQ